MVLSCEGFAVGGILPLPEHFSDDLGFRLVRTAASLDSVTLSHLNEIRESVVEKESKMNPREKLREKLMLTMIELLNREVECLRSVLSEFDGDKYEYVQMGRADKLRDVIENMQCEL